MVSLPVLTSSTGSSYQPHGGSDAVHLQAYVVGTLEHEYSCKQEVTRSLLVTLLQ